MAQNLLTKKELAQALNVSPRTIDRHRRADWIQGVHFVAFSSRVTRYDLEAVMHWLRQPNREHLKWCQRQLKSKG
jgi:predicted DNA-binding transcriptional regulator YafY